MKGLARAEWLRFRKRGSLQLIVLAVPLLVAFFFLAGFASIGETPPFDAEATRARLISEGVVSGGPPEEVEQILDSLVESERINTEQTRAQQAHARSTYAFPNSLVTVLGNGFLVFFALILLTATTVGDEFGWGTIRTALLASSHRLRMLLVRFAALGGVALFLLALLLLLGTVLPVVLVAFGADLPATSTFDLGAFLVLVLGEVVACMTVIGFAALATVIARSGSLTLVAALVYLAVEAAILVLLFRFDLFRQDGSMAWLPDALPLRGVTTLINGASRAASGLGSFPGEVVGRDLGVVVVPILALTAWGVLFGLLALRRFTRMDIVE